MNQGEICLCTSRIYGHEDIFDEFLAKFVEAAKALKVGDPNDPDMFMGALNSKIHLDKVVKYAKLATEEGGTVHCCYGKTELNLTENICDIS